MAVANHWFYALAAWVWVDLDVHMFIVLLKDPYIHLWFWCTISRCRMHDAIKLHKSPWTIYLPNSRSTKALAIEYNIFHSRDQVLHGVNIWFWSHLTTKHNSSCNVMVVVKAQLLIFVGSSQEDLLLCSSTKLIVVMEVVLNSWF